MKKTSNFQSYFLILLMLYGSAFAQGTKKRPPIIDVHVHAMKANPNFANDLCPWFLKNMPGSDPKQPAPSFLNGDCPDPLKAAKSDAEILHKWHKAATNRIITSLGVSSGKEMTVKAFEDSLSGGFYKVMGEVAPQYQGMSPSYMTLDEYFGVAEKLGVPVGIHMGTGGNGMANITSPKYRASLGRPFLLEDMLARHPKLKIWVMHAGYPMIDEMIALMGANAYVYVDLAGFIWSYPLE